MKYLLLGILVASNYIINAQNTRPTLHLICLTDQSTASGLNLVSQNDESIVFQTFKQVALYANHQISYTPLYTENLDSLGLFAKLANVKNMLNPDVDAVVFYYSGHGSAQMQGSSMLPIIKSGTSRTRLVALNKVATYFRTGVGKSPKLLIVLADCCNERTITQSGSIIEKKSTEEEKLFRAAANKLMSTKGEIFASSSSYGQRSYHNGHSSYFTAMLTASLSDELYKGESATWTNILSTTKRYTSNIVLKEKQDIQQPVFFINLN